MAQLDRKRIAIYLLVAFGFSWGMALIIYLTGGIVGSPVLVEEIGITLALALMTAMMFGPLLGHIVTRLVTREGWQGMWLQPHIKRGWKYWLLVWAVIPVLIAAGAVLYFLLYPQHFDPSSELFQAQLAAVGVTEGYQIILAVQLLTGILLAPLLNAIPILGEEFGWRAYLQPKLLPLGERPAMLWMGLIWGVWHAPVIAMGYNYGFNYPGFPWVGILLFCVFTFTFGTLIGWATLRAGSVWPAVIGHGLLNGLAAGPALFVQGNPSTLLGPLPIGLLGGLGFTLVALYLFFYRLRGKQEVPVDSQPVDDGAISLEGA